MAGVRTVVTTANAIGRLARGSRLLRRRNPALASVMGMALATDMTEVPLDARPSRELGIEPRSTTDAIDPMLGRRSTL